MQFFPMKYRINVQSSLEKDEIKQELFSCATAPLTIHCVMLESTVSVHPRVRILHCETKVKWCVSTKESYM